jgi:hypothetical protein
MPNSKHLLCQCKKEPLSSDKLSKHLWLGFFIAVIAGFKLDLVA